MAFSEACNTLHATEKAITANQEQEPVESRQQIGPFAALDSEDIDYKQLTKPFHTPVPKIFKKILSQLSNEMP